MYCISKCLLIVHYYFECNFTNFMFNNESLNEVQKQRFYTILFLKYKYFYREGVTKFRMYFVGSLIKSMKEAAFGKEGNEDSRCPSEENEKVTVIIQQVNL